MNYKKLLEDCDFIKVKNTIEIRPHDNNDGFAEYVNHIFNRGNFVECWMGEQRIDIRRNKIIIYSDIPIQASNEENYRQFAVGNIGVLTYIYNVKKF